MKPVEFPECNIVAAENQPEYQALPAHRAPTKNGEVIACWRLSFVERLRALFLGKIWVSLWCFDHSITPSLLTTRKREVIGTGLYKFVVTYSDPQSLKVKSATTVAKGLMQAVGRVKDEKGEAIRIEEVFPCDEN